MWVTGTIPPGSFTSTNTNEHPASMWKKRWGDPIYFEEVMGKLRTQRRSRMAFLD